MHGPPQGLAFRPLTSAESGLKESCEALSVRVPKHAEQALEPRRCRLKRKKGCHRNNVKNYSEH